MLPQLLLNGLIAGAVYSLISIGYTMIYGVGKLINFAHGELYMSGAYLFFTFYILLSWNLYISSILAVALVGILGLILERVAYRPFQEYSRLVPLITTIGASTFLKAVAILLFGVQTKSLLRNETYQNPLVYKGISITPIQVISIIVSLILMISLSLFLKKTKMGKAIRATSEDRLSAKYLGIKVNKVTATTFLIGGMLAAVAGILVGYDQNISPTMGILAGFKGFTAAVLGGIGNIPGAVLGGICLGLAENLGAGYISSANKDSISFIILLLILLLRPNGILGEK